MQLSLSTWPSCPKRELQNQAVLTQGPGRDPYSLFPSEEGNGLTSCAAENPELAVQPCKSGPKEFWPLSWTRSYSAPKAGLRPARSPASPPVFRANFGFAVRPYNAPLLLWQFEDWTCRGEKLLAHLCFLLLSAYGDVCPGTGEVSALILECNFHDNGA